MVSLKRGLAGYILILQRLGLPLAAICLLREGIQNTQGEVQLIAQELRRIGGDRVTLVTSKSHSRRVRVTWRALVGNLPQAVVRYATEDPYHPRHWWRQARDAMEVSREVFGLLNAWTGLPVRQGSRSEEILR